MIRVNLLNSKISSTMGGVQGISFDVSGGAEEKKENLKKIVYMIIPLVLAIAYENWNIDDLNDRLRRVRNEDNQLTQQIDVLKKEAGRAPEVEQEVKKMEEKLKIVTDLSKKRLRELKALDFLQNLLPEGVWLKALKYDGEKVRFEGQATSDDDMNRFVDLLDKSSQFEEVILVKATELKIENGIVKEFLILSKLGAMN